MLPNLTLLPFWRYYLITGGFHRTFTTGTTSQQRMHTPPETWSCAILDLHLFNIETIFSYFRTCHVYGPIEIPTTLDTFTLLWYTICNLSIAWYYDLNQGIFTDDTSANAIRFTCRKLNGNNTYQLNWKKGQWGEFGSWSKECPMSTAICGMRVKVEWYQGGGDDTALNNIEFYCCGDWMPPRSWVMKNCFARFDYIC